MSAPAGQNAFASLFKSTTRLSQALGAVLVLGYVSQLVYSPTRAYLALVPGRTIPCVWNVVTCGFLEQNLLTLLVSVLAVLALSRVIEPVYGSREYLKFLAIVGTSAGLGAFITVYIAYTLNRNAEGNLLYSEISGFHGVIAGLLVATKQLTPDTEVTLFRAIKLRVKHLAALYVLGTAVGSVFIGGVIRTVPFVLCGAYAAWLYLRFFQPSPTDANQLGDSNPDFSFASFFPAPVQPLVDGLAGAASKLFKLDHAAVSGTPGSITGAVPAARSTEASRRRERGARALEERLGLKSTVDVRKEEAAPPVDIESGTGGNGEGLALNPPAETA